ncbi:MAG: hypothetical protein ACK5L6_11965 [Anaerorhabdus sp.]|uniref:hypothetical protein n=1 Tax=Anaerorhabdus sp. TaxID=1872524 RepID=UPI003A899FDA
MKKGLLTTLLLASGAALAVYLLKEEQNKKSYDNNDEKRMIKLRTEEESQELVRTIQEIENLPFRHFEEINNTKEENKEFHHIDLNSDNVRVFGLGNNHKSNDEMDVQSYDNLETLDLPSFIHESPLDYVETEELLLDEIKPIESVFDNKEEPVSVAQDAVESAVMAAPLMREINPDEIYLESLVDDANNDFNDLDFPSFITKNETEELPIIKPLSVDEPQQVEEINIEEEAPGMDTDLSEELLNLYADDNENFGETAIFDLPKMFAEKSNASSMMNTIDIPGQSSQPVNPFMDLQQEDLEEIDLAELFKSIDDDSVIADNLSNPSLEETTEIKLVDIDEDEIKRLFNTDSDELEEIVVDDIHHDEVPLKKELSEDEFEEFKKRLIHVEEDDIDLINLSDSKPFDTVANPNHEEIDIINFGNVVENPSIKLEDIVFENVAPINENGLEDLEELELPAGFDITGELPVLEEIELPTSEDDEVLEEIQLPADSREDTSEIFLSEINLNEVLNENEDYDDLEITEEEYKSTPQPIVQNDGEFPEAVYQINTLYPYLNPKFINAVFNNFGAFNEEFEIGSACRITHKVQFPDSQNLISFIDIVKGLNYEIAGTDENQNILIVLDFENEESKILSEIYNISNQVNYLDGLYRGYELEHI